MLKIPGYKGVYGEQILDRRQQLAIRSNRCTAAENVRRPESGGEYDGCKQYGTLLAGRSYCLVARLIQFAQSVTCRVWR